MHIPHFLFLVNPKIPLSSNVSVGFWVLKNCDLFSLYLGNPGYPMCWVSSLLTDVSKLWLSWAAMFGWNRKGGMPAWEWDWPQPKRKSEHPPASAALRWEQGKLWEQHLLSEQNKTHWCCPAKPSVQLSPPPPHRDCKWGSLSQGLDVMLESTTECHELWWPLKIATELGFLEPTARSCLDQRLRGPVTSRGSWTAIANVGLKL